MSQWLHLTGRVEYALEDLVRLRGVSDKLAACIGLTGNGGRAAGAPRAFRNLGAIGAK